MKRKSKASTRFQKINKIKLKVPKLDMKDC